ncbi:hypothetical protein KR018_000945 [Drosophila ironensis]|nr:hypothetical protein KR018_000945 [Drosophila ironensis]
MFESLLGPCPSLYCLINGPEKEESLWIRMLRSVFSFLIGLLMGYLLWELVAINFRLNRDLFGLSPFWIFVLVISIIYALSRAVRTVILLVFVALIGRSGRTYLRAMAFAFIIAGPIENLVANAGEVSRVFVCTTVLTYNLSKTRFDLMAKPFTNTLQNMRGDVEEIRQTFDELQDVLTDLKYAVEQSDIEDKMFGDKDAFSVFQRLSRSPGGRNNSEPRDLPMAYEVQEQFQRNIRNRCKHQLRSGHRACQQVFRQGYRKCTSKFPSLIAGAICWPYRVDIICEMDLFGNPEEVCDSSEVVPRNFGETYVELLRAEQELFANSSEIEVSYKLRDEELLQSQMQSAQQASQAFAEDFERRRRQFTWILTVLREFLCLFILRLVYSSIWYYIKYRTDVEFDNIYITDYFRHVDKRRQNKRRGAILPLRTYEKSKYVDLEKTFDRSHEESSRVVYNLLQFLLELVFAAVFILLDRMVVQLMLIIRKRSLITYHQEGEHEVRFHISGAGLMARLLRTTMRNFNIHERVSTTLSNEECLPNPHTLPWSFYYKLLLIYAVILVLIYNSTAFLRLRRLICSYFYYKREKQRILFLYNIIRRQRIVDLDNLKRHTDYNWATHNIQLKVNLLLRLRLGYPKLFGWLRHWKCAKLSCLVCREREDASFVICYGCGAPYCSGCFEDINSICLHCGLKIERAKGGAENSEDGDSSLEIYCYRKMK